MKGYIRKRGDTWEFIVDIGMAQAQRCPVCNKRFWVERRPLEACPTCGGELAETEERRRAIKGGFRTRKAAQAAMAKVMVAVEEKNYIVPARLTVREFLIREWLPAAKGTIRPTTYRSYVQHVECHIMPHIGSMRLEKVTGATLNALYAKLALEGKRDGKSGLSPASVHHVHACAHRAFKDAVRWNRLLRNPADVADPPQVKGTGNREMKTWEAGQLKGFLEVTHDDPLNSLWHVLAMTGMRRGEGLGLRWEDVDFEAGRLAVRRSLVPLAGTVIVSEPKTARGRRSIAIDPETVAVLKAQAAQQLRDQQEWGEAWSDSGYVFTRPDGSPHHPEVISRSFRQAVQQSMLPRIRLHDLRHTHATLALRAGVHPKVVSERLGHATVAITLDIYSHAIPAMQEEAAVLIADLVFAK